MSHYCLDNSCLQTSRLYLCAIEKVCYLCTLITDNVEIFHIVRAEEKRRYWPIKQYVKAEVFNQSSRTSKLSLHHALPLKSPQHRNCLYYIRRRAWNDLQYRNKNVKDRFVRTRTFLTTRTWETCAAVTVFIPSALRFT